jgi:hypothetical protein
VNADRGISGEMAIEQRLEPDRTVTAEQAPNAAVGTPRWTTRIAPIAGPLLICGTVLLVLNGYAFRGLISVNHPDLLPFWYPTWCYLGKTLAAGHIAAWNSHVMGGVPFAADPQSGWGYVPAMALFSTLPCHVAIRWAIVFHPLVAGLGLFAFLRSESLSRTGATVGGLSLALGVAGSGFLTYMPFAGMFAWMAVMLAAASRLLRSSNWPSRLAWLLATALAWGQLAAAHLSDGLVVGTGALACFAAVRLVRDVRAHVRSSNQALAVAGLLLVALPAVSLAVLLPRLSYIPETSLGQGYHTLQEVVARLTGRPLAPIVIGGYGPTFPFSFIAWGDVYLGATALALAFAGWRAKKHRGLWISFLAFAVISYVVGLHGVAKVVTPAVGDSLIATFYSHAVHRLSWGLIVAIPVLAAVGVDAWRERATWATRTALIGPAVLVWVALPFVFGFHWRHPLLIVLAALGALVVLGLTAVRPSAAALIPLVLAAELATNGLTLKTTPCCDDSSVPATSSTVPALQQGNRPTVSAAGYDSAGPIVGAIQRGGGGRYVSLGQDLWRSAIRRAPQYWPFMATQRSMLFGIEEAQGYNPAQLMRYWSFVRAVQRARIFYNSAYLVRPEPLAFDLLQVAYVIQRSSAHVTVPGADRVATEGGFALFAVPNPSPRSSVVTSWEVAGSPEAALERILRSGFDPNVEAILETNPQLPRSSGGGLTSAPASARYLDEGAQVARVLVDVPSPALVLVRNVYDRNWHATVDGHPAPVLAADSLIQAVAVPAGHHVIRLSYDDPAIAFGLLGSALAIAALLAAAGALAARERRRSRDRAS